MDINAHNWIKLMPMNAHEYNEYINIINEWESLDMERDSRELIYVMMRGIEWIEVNDMDPETDPKMNAKMDHTIDPKTSLKMDPKMGPRMGPKWIPKWSPECVPEWLPKCIQKWIPCGSGEAAETFI